VAAFVGQDGVESVAAPVGVGAADGGVGFEDLAGGGAEDGLVGRGVGVAQLVGDEVAAEGVGEGDATSSGAAFWLDGAFDSVPASADMDQVLVEVDVVPFQALEFSAAQSGVEGGCPERLVLGWQGGDEGVGFFGSGDAFAAAADGGQEQLSGRVLGDVVEVVGAAVDRAQGQDRVSDCARRGAAGDEVVGQCLDVVSGDARETQVAEPGQDVRPKRHPVRTQR